MAKQLRDPASVGIIKYGASTFDPVKAVKDFGTKMAAIEAAKAEKNKEKEEYNLKLLSKTASTKFKSDDLKIIQPELEKVKNSFIDEMIAGKGEVSALGMQDYITKITDLENRAKISDAQYKEYTNYLDYVVKNADKIDYEDGKKKAAILFDPEEWLKENPDDPLAATVKSDLESVKLDDGKYDTQLFRGLYTSSHYSPIPIEKSTKDWDLFTRLDGLSPVESSSISSTYDVGGVKKSYTVSKNDKTALKDWAYNDYLNGVHAGTGASVKDKVESDYATTKETTPNDEAVIEAQKNAAISGLPEAEEWYAIKVIKNKYQESISTTYAEDKTAGGKDEIEEVTPVATQSWDVKTPGGTKVTITGKNVYNFVDKPVKLSQVPVTMTYDPKNGKLDKTPLGSLDLDVSRIFTITLNGQDYIIADASTGTGTKAKEYYVPYEGEIKKAVEEKKKLLLLGQTVTSESKAEKITTTKMTYTDWKKNNPNGTWSEYVTYKNS